MQMYLCLEFNILKDIIFSSKIYTQSKVICVQFSEHLDAAWPLWKKFKN